MKRTITGIIVAAVVLYLWGFVVWGFGPYSTMIWGQASDDEAAGQLLREQFPENGTYYVPAFTHDEEKLGQLFEKGPVAFVHILAADGRPVMDPSIMVNGFVANLIVIILISILMNQVSSALPCQFSRIRFAALAGLASVMLIDIGDVAWWQMDLGWMSYRAVYHVSAWILTGAILGYFMNTPTRKTAEAV